MVRYTVAVFCFMDVSEKTDSVVYGLTDSLRGYTGSGVLAVIVLETGGCRRGKASVELYRKRVGDGR